MKQTPPTLLTGFAAVAALGALLALAGPAQAHDSCGPGGQHPDTHPHCSGGGGGDGGGGDIATNDITARWNGAVNGTGTTPRYCMLDSKPQPKGTHTAYSCAQEPIHTVSVNLSGGVVLNTKGSPTPEDSAQCTAGFAFVAYPNLQFIVAVGGDVCTDPGGCSLRVHSAMNGQPGAIPPPYSFVKLVGDGLVPQSASLNPFACPTDGSPPTTQAYPIETIELRAKVGGGSKANLVCLFEATGLNTTSIEVTPVCP